MSHPAASNAGIRPQEVSRKQFQNTAVAVVNAHAETLKNHDARLNIVTTGLADLTETVMHNAESLHTFAQDQTRISGQQTEAINVVLQTAHGYTEPLRRGFLGRLKWLLAGR